MKNKIYWLLLLLFLTISIFSCATQVFNPYNYYFGSEQATEYLVTKSIVVDHKLILTAHQGGPNSFLKTPGFNYLLAIPFILTKGDPFGGRIFMFLISLVTVVLAFVFANRMFNIKVASFVTFLISISPILKDYSASVSPPYFVPLLTVIFIYLIFEIIKGRKILLIWLLFLVGFMTNFEMATAITIFLLLFISSFITLKNKMVPIKYYFLAGGAFFINFTPLIIFDLNNNFSNSKGIFRVIASFGSNASNHVVFNLPEIVKERLSVFIWNFSSTFSTSVYIWVPLLIVMTFGVYKYINDKKTDKKRKSFVLYIAIIPIFSFLFLLFFPGNYIQQWWILDLIIIYCLLLGLSLDFLSKNPKLKPLVVLILLVLSFLFVKRTIFIYKTQFVYPPKNYIKEDQAVKYVFNDKHENNFGVLTYSNESSGIFDYLIWWEGQEFYHYLPYRETRGLYYRIIDHNYLISNKNKNDNIKDGKLIWRKELTNRFIIEKIQSN